MEKNTALLVMDVETAIVKMLKEKEVFLNNLKKAIQDARDNEIPVIYIVVGFRKGYPEVSSNNKSFSTIKNAERNLDSEDGMKVDEMVAPLPGDMVIIKKRVSAFTGSDLEVVLRSHQIDHIVLAGIATSGVVLSTVREAADKDYRITVLSDCCADADEETHHILTTKILPKQADVITSSEWNGGKYS
jgi:nicotinamidase-related amidase